jgi:hypothetical protein
MKLARRFLLLQVCILAAVPFPATAQEAAEPVEAVREEYVRTRGEQFTLGGTVTVPANEIRRGEIVNVGGDVLIEGRISGNVVVIGGSVVVSGEIGDQLVAVMSDVHLEDGAEVGRGLVNVLGDLEDEGANVHGEFVNLDLGLRLPGLGAPLSALAILVFWWKLIKLVLVFFLIVLMAALVGDRVQRIGEEMPLRPLLSLFVGFVFCILGVPLIFILMVVSLIGIPMIPIAILIFMVLTCLGLAGIFHFLGHRIGRLFGRDMSLLGAMLLGYLIIGLVMLIPFLGWMVWTVTVWMGIGLLFTTRLGSAPPRGAEVTAPPPPAATAEPAEPADPPDPDPS